MFPAGVAAPAPLTDANYPFDDSQTVRLFGAFHSGSDLDKHARGYRCSRRQVGLYQNPARNCVVPRRHALLVGERQQLTSQHQVCKFAARLERRGDKPLVAAISFVTPDGQRA